MNQPPRSRISKFYKHSIEKRLEILHEREMLSDDDYISLLNNLNILKPEQADRMIENVIGVFGLPMGVGLNFIVNNKPYLIPMVVEEPSIVAAVSSAAKAVMGAGGFECESDPPILLGQVQVVEVENVAKAKNALLQNKEEILNLANSLHPNMVARGGGALDLEVVVHSGTADKGDMVVVQLMVDTRDAMGANLINSMCEGIAPLVEKITNGRVFLRILSNLADRAITRAHCHIPLDLLEFNGTPGKEVRDGIILANDFALTDTYRAATHNKGIMNGIDAVALATGNDWRAIEASAHAYAARGTQYTALTKWQRAKDGGLSGTLEIPLKVGTVGGSLKSNPSVEIAMNLLGVESAPELSQVMGAVGLAQNFAALRALVTEGIQRGHMTLHARSVASTAGAYPEIFESVVERLIESGEIKVWKAREIIEELEEEKQQVSVPEMDSKEKEQLPAGHGKVILLGEHAVVYNSHAIAAPIQLAMQAKVWDSTDGIHLLIPRWSVEENIQKGANHKYSIYKSLDMILEELKLAHSSMKIEVFPNVPRAMGLGGSAALAVAIIRALDEHFNLELSEDDVYHLSYESEKFAHGNPSGIDNTLATYGKFMLFQRGDPPKTKEIRVPEPLPIVIGLTGVESLTAKMVANVREGWKNNRSQYERIFQQIDDLTLEAYDAIEEYQLEKLGELMNINQGLLNALQVSSREIEELIEIARRNGALGAKLTGGGGGGAILALCSNTEQANKVAFAIRKSGYEALVTKIGSEADKTIVEDIPPHLTM